MNEQKIFVYVGTYTRQDSPGGGQSEGIYVYEMELKSGAWTFVQKVIDQDNPSYLALDPQQTYLYAANEVGDFGGQAQGAVSAFRIDSETGMLTYLNQAATQGAAPCHLSVAQAGQVVLVANYSGGNLCVLPIQDGAVGEATQVIQHKGSSINPNRQEGPHAHSINIDGHNRYAVAADLGLDKVLVYQLDLNERKLILASDLSTKPGAGPRHVDFHPNNHFAYVINELDSSLMACRYDDEAGTLTALQTVSTLPNDFEGNNSCADIHVAPQGKFVYGSNRGHNSIVIFAIDETSGQVSYVGHESTQGRIPRNFVIDPSGTFLYVANQDTNNITHFRIDQETGRLIPTGDVTDVPTPVCIKIKTK